MSPATLESPTRKSGRGKVRVPALDDLQADPVESAQAAGLRYVHDSGPGIQRERLRDDFVYIGLDSRPIDDPDEIKRIKAIGIPPAYTAVWICPIANGHIQATGRDVKGRKQYRYHPLWREVRDGAKYGRMIVFAEDLPKIRENVNRHLALRGIPREKVLAVVVRLLETTMIRVGNEEYAKANDSFGLTTMRGRHVDIAGATMHFHFRGKSGKTHQIDLKDRRLAQIVRRCQELPGQDLFEYVDEKGEIHAVSSSDVNDYLHEISGVNFTAKDFRTWGGTTLAALTLLEFGPSSTQAGAKKNVVHAIEHVSERLGNTPAICRKCYIHPEIINAYLDGSLNEALSGCFSRVSLDDTVLLQPEEVAVAAFLRERLAQGKLHPAVV